MISLIILSLFCFVLLLVWSAIYNLQFSFGMKLICSFCLYSYGTMQLYCTAQLLLRLLPCVCEMHAHNWDLNSFSFHIVLYHFISCQIVIIILSYIPHDRFVHFLYYMIWFGIPCLRNATNMKHLWWHIIDPSCLLCFAACLLACLLTCLKCYLQYSYGWYLK